MAKLSTNVSPNNFQLHPSPFLHRNSIINWNNKVTERNCRLKRSVSAIQIITTTVAVTNSQSLTDQQGQAQWLHWVIHHLLTLTKFPAAETASFDYLTFLPKIPRECSDGTEQRIAGCGGHHPPYHSARQQESITLAADGVVLHRSVPGIIVRPRMAHNSQFHAAYPSNAVVLLC